MFFIFNVNVDIYFFRFTLLNLNSAVRWNNQFVCPIITMFTN